MAENRSFEPTTAQANRAAEQGLGVGQKEINAQRDPNRAAAANPRRAEPFPKTAAGRRGDQASGSGDRPEEDWSDATDEGVALTANNTRRAEADRGQGKKTRAAQKDKVSRRG
jgi:hypothetical protein